MYIIPYAKIALKFQRQNDGTNSEQQEAAREAVESLETAVEFELGPVTKREHYAYYNVQ